MATRVLPRWLMLLNTRGDECARLWRRADGISGISFVPRVEGWLPESVFSLGNGLSSVEAWFTTALDIEEVLSGVGGDQLHVMVTDVIKSFDTVDRSIVRLVLGSSLPQVYVSLGVGRERSLRVVL